MKPISHRLLLNEESTFTSSTNGLSSEPQIPSLPQYTNNNNSPRKSPFNPTSTIDSSMAVTVLVLISALFFVGFFSVYVRRLAEENAAAAAITRRRRRGGTPSSRSPPHGMDPTTVSALPLFAYDGSVKGPVDCAVCLSEFEEKETVKMIPRCGHVYHPVCIDLWLERHGSCPLCRSTKLFAERGEVRLEVFDEMPERGEDDNENDAEVDRIREFVVLRRTNSCSSFGKREQLRRSCSL